MAFTVEVLRGETTYTISDGNPFSIEMAEMLGGASVRNIEESGPYQDGVTHLDHRLEPRTMTLKLYVKGASAAALDGHRDTLNAMFKPVRGVPITLRVTRDDGEVRQINTYRTGPLAIPLVPEHRPGNLHKAVVQLRAPDPTFYDPDEVTEVSDEIGDWYNAFNTIAGSVVMDALTTVGTAEPMDYSGSVPNGSAWTIYVRTSRVTPGTNPTLFQIVDDSLNISNFVTSAHSNLRRMNVSIGFQDSTGAGFIAGTADYFFIRGTASAHVWRDDTLLLSDDSPFSNSGIPETSAGTMYWRANINAAQIWPDPVPFAAIYSTALTDVQRAALQFHIDNFGTTDTGRVIPVEYGGDVDSYPVIELYGPLNDPVLTNFVTNDVIDLTGGTIGSFDVWTIDLTYGRKSIENSLGSSVLEYLSSDSNLTTFRLIASGQAAGGFNPIGLTNTNGTASGSVAVIYKDKYISF